MSDDSIEAWWEQEMHKEDEAFEREAQSELSATPCSATRLRNNDMKTLTDTDPMPFGKHKGEPMQDVPASYLHYLWQNGLKNDKTSDVADYIRRNVNALKQEHPDGVWS